ncbi:alcohol dehydrogenase [Heterostelium album PN500]|uniref:Alcohol dehydrogenase n=1 Tax=Heterostelium pallidum (strain ATCC 26659 / Pp 5 / PN500) TaxID=670386 RepID=D3BK51_HETP5|nr:alcohol dehydrogenase [Heterostelium album PN500]EFA78281.1 alcohol dehydrogenase [Heterostelium album PN500]|eukprot:XP_020430406.1 alcohol dehydrogenase [Heterostelium album PN500]
MREIVITKPGSYDVLQVRTSPDPTVGAGQVKINVKACGLNFAEVMARQGLYPDAPPTPCVVGYEAAGVVGEVGEGVTSVSVGQRVVVCTKFGAHSDTIVLSHQMVFPIPDDMTFAEASSIPVNYITAYHMLFRVANIQPGARVLVHMAAGGVGVAAIQLLKTIPDVTIFGTASPSKHEFIRQLGCTHPIDYTTKDYATEITNMYQNELEGKRGVDVIIDPLGEFKSGYHILNPCGHIIAFGVANMVSGSTRSIFNILKQYMRIPSFNPLHLMNDNKTVSGVNIGHLFIPSQIPMMKQEMLEILELFKQGKCKAIVSEQFTFEQAGEAHKYIEQRKNIGKVVLVPTEADRAMTPNS